MKIEVIQSMINNSLIVAISNEEKKLYFSITSLDKKYFINDIEEAGVFYYLQKYWDTLEKETRNEIFSIYEEISVGLTSNFTKRSLDILLEKNVNKLLDYHPLEKIRNFVMYDTTITVPSHFATVYEENTDNNTTRDKTYIVSDYIDLIALSLSLRCLIPIWGEYIFTVRSETGVIYKELSSFQLMHSHDINVSKPMLKLRTYIENILNKTGKSGGKPMDGISSQENVIYNLSLTVIRRLCVGDLVNLPGSKGDLITFIFNYVTQRVSGAYSAGDGGIRDKPELKENGSMSDDKTSAIERYKLQFTIAPAIKEELEYACSDLIAIYDRLTINRDYDFLERCLASSRELIDHEITTEQTAILSWIIKPIISPRSIHYISKFTIVNLLGIAQAVLHSNNHKYLSILITSRADVGSDINTINVGLVDSKTKLKPENIEAISKLFPLTKTVTKKKVTNKENIVLNSIDDIFDRITEYSWIATCDKMLIKEVTGSSSNRLIILPNLRDLLIELLIDINNKKI